MRIITLLLILTLSSQALACPHHLRMEEGSIAPCSGHFFNDETEQSIRKDVRDNEIRKEQLRLKDLQVNTLKEDRDRWKDEAENQAEARHKMDGDLTKGLLYGIGITLLVILATGQAQKVGR